MRVVSSTCGLMLKTYLLISFHALHEVSSEMLSMSFLLILLLLLKQILLIKKRRRENCVSNNPSLLSEAE